MVELAPLFNMVAWKHCTSFQDSNRQVTFRKWHKEGVKWKIRFGNLWKLLTRQKLSFRLANFQHQKYSSYIFTDTSSIGTWEFNRFWQEGFEDSFFTTLNILLAIVTKQLTSYVTNINFRNTSNTKPSWKKEKKFMIKFAVLCCTNNKRYHFQ